MPIKFGNISIPSIYKGNTKIDSIYHGLNLVYKSSLLPSGYTELEYLESTGTQYIDTGYKPNGNTKVEIKYQTPTQNTKQQGIFGARDGLRNRFTLFTGAKKDAFQVDYNTNNSLSDHITNITGVDGAGVNTIRISNSFVINDILINQVEKVNFQNTLDMYLFANNNNTAQLPMIGRIWYFKIYDNDVLVRNFIPALDPNGTPCMYDLVSKTTFYNAGSGTFNYG